MSTKLLVLGLLYVWLLAILKSIDLANGNQFIMLLSGAAVSATMLAIFIYVDEQQKKINRLENEVNQHKESAQRRVHISPVQLEGE